MIEKGKHKKKGKIKKKGKKKKKQVNAALRSGQSGSELWPPVYNPEWIFLASNSLGSVWKFNPWDWIFDIQHIAEASSVIGCTWAHFFFSHSRFLNFVCCCVGRCINLARVFVAGRPFPRYTSERCNNSGWAPKSGIRDPGSGKSQK